MASRKGTLARQFEKILTDFSYGSSADWPDCVSQLLLYFEDVQREAKRHHDRMHPPPPVPDVGIGMKRS